MSMADIFVIVLFSLLIVSKGAVLLYLFHKRCSRRSAVQTISPEVLVEDPMTQRIVLGEQYGNSCTSLDVTLPPPAYTIKDQHLEFADDPPPPPFSTLVSGNKSRRKSSPASLGRSLSSRRHRTSADVSATEDAPNDDSTAIAIPDTAHCASRPQIHSCPSAAQEASSSSVTVSRRGSITISAREWFDPLPQHQQLTRNILPLSPVSVLCPSIVVHM